MQFLLPMKNTENVDSGEKYCIDLAVFQLGQGLPELEISFPVHKFLLLNNIFSKYQLSMDISLDTGGTEAKETEY
jgi:hypothetical protein